MSFPYHETSNQVNRYSLFDKIDYQYPGWNEPNTTFQVRSFPFYNPNLGGNHARGRRHTRSNQRRYNPVLVFPFGAKDKYQIPRVTVNFQQIDNHRLQAEAPAWKQRNFDEWNGIMGLTLPQLLGHHLAECLKKFVSHILAFFGFFNWKLSVNSSRPKQKQSCD